MLWSRSMAAAPVAGHTTYLAEAHIRPSAVRKQDLHARRGSSHCRQHERREAFLLGNRLLGDTLILREPARSGITHVIRMLDVRAPSAQHPYGLLKAAHNCAAQGRPAQLDTGTIIKRACGFRWLLRVRTSSVVSRFGEARSSAATTVLSGRALLQRGIDLDTAMRTVSPNCVERFQPLKRQRKTETTCRVLNVCAGAERNQLLHHVRVARKHCRMQRRLPLLPMLRIASAARFHSGARCEAHAPSRDFSSSSCIRRPRRAARPRVHLLPSQQATPAQAYGVTADCKQGSDTSCQNVSSLLPFRPSLSLLW